MERSKHDSFLKDLKLIAIVVFSMVLCLGQQHLFGSSDLEDYFIFQHNNKKGVRNSDDEIVIPAEYDDLGWSIGEFHPLRDILGYKEKSLWGLMTLKNTRIVAPTYHNLYPLNRQLIVASVWDQAKEKERYGLIDLKGNVMLEFEYAWLSMFNNLIVASKMVDGELRFGMMDLSYQVVIPFKYHQIKTLNNQFAIIVEKDKSGLVNASGQLVVPPKYDQIELKGNTFRGKLFDTYEIKTEQNQLLSSSQLKSLESGTKGVLIGKGNNFAQLISTNGQLITRQQGSEFVDFSDKWVVVRSNGLYGLLDFRGNDLLPNIYRSIWISDGYAGIQKKEGWWQLMNLGLKIVSEREYQEIKPASEGLFAVKRQNSWGFVNNSGEEIIPPQYDQVSGFDHEQAYAKYLGSWGVIDPAGNWLVQPRYDKLEKIDQSTYLFQTGDQHGIVNTEKTELYQSGSVLLSAGTGVLEVGEDGRYSLISLQGERMLSPQYTSIKSFKEDPSYYRFENEEGLGIFNIEQQTFFLDTAIQELRTLNEEYIGVKINNQYGLIDLNGKLRIANRYDDVGVFNEDMLPVKIRGRWGYVDRLERLKIQPVYETADHFVNDLAIVSQNRKYGLVNKSGKIILPLEYDRIERLDNGQYINYRGQKAGLVDSDGLVMLYPAYDQLEILESGRLKISKNGKLGVITKRGKMLIPAVYDDVVYDKMNQVYILTKKYSWDLIEL